LRNLAEVGQLEASPKFVEKAVEHLSAIFADTLAATADSLASTADQLAQDKFKPVAGEVIFFIKSHTMCCCSYRQIYCPSLKGFYHEKIGLVTICSRGLT
jgi:hypothetical protein